MLVEVDSLSTGMTRACSGLQFITAFGNTYSPVGYLGGIDKIQEESDVFPRAVRIWFAAISSSQIQDVLTENMFNCPVRLYSTFLTDSLTCVSTPEQRFGGFVNMVDMKLKDPQRGDYFELEVESRLVRPARAQYFNRETLWTFYASSGDTFFDYMSQIPFRKGKWGLPGVVDFYDPTGGSTFDLNQLNQDILARLAGI
jgi:hypothetical protein